MLVLLFSQFEWNLTDLGVRPAIRHDYLAGFSGQISSRIPGQLVWPDFWPDFWLDIWPVFQPAGCSGCISSLISGRLDILARDRYPAGFSSWISGRISGLVSGQISKRTSSPDIWPSIQLDIHGEWQVVRGQKLNVHAPPRRAVLPPYCPAAREYNYFSARQGLY